MSERVEMSDNEERDDYIIAGALIPGDVILLGNDEVRITQIVIPNYGPVAVIHGFIGDSLVTVKIGKNIGVKLLARG